MPGSNSNRISLNWLALAAAGLAVAAAGLAIAAARSATRLEAVLIGAAIGVALGALPWLLIGIARLSRREVKR